MNCLRKLVSAICVESKLEILGKQSCSYLEVDEFRTGEEFGKEVVLLRRLVFAFPLGGAHGFTAHHRAFFCGSLFDHW